MTETRRLLDGADSNDFERWLLKSAAQERPAHFVTVQMRDWLGLSTVSVAARASTLSSLKLTLLAVSLSTLLGVHATEQVSYQQVSTPAGANAVAGVASPGASGEESLALDIDANSTIDSLQAIAAPPGPMAVVTTAKARKNAHSKERATYAEGVRTTNGTDLREEIRLLDLARNAVKSHQSEEALVSLNAYATRFSDGAFKQEASVLRMQALAQQGDMGRASSMAKRFVESNPNSPYVSRAARIAKGSSVSEPSQ